MAFGGVAAASFTVVSDGEITAVVPAPAATGHITVTTGGATATSPGVFTVLGSVDDGTIRATVPYAATTGPIAVTTAHGTAASAGTFTVTH